MDPAIVISVVSLVTVQISSVLGLWLRLRWRARTEQAQQDYLTRLSLESPGSRLEVDDVQGDGRRLRVCLTPAVTKQGEEAAA
jgi:hypothetical protein